MRKHALTFSRWLAASVAIAGATWAFAQPASAPPDTAAQSAATLDATTRREVAETFATALADGYAYADLGQKMAQVIRDKLAAHAYDGMTSGEDFALALQTDARTIANDKHLRVSYNPKESPGRRGPGPGGPGGPGGVRPPGAQNGAIVRIQVLPGNIGYLEINGVPPLEAAKPFIEAAFAFLHGTDALILDLRGNGGGTPDTVALYMSYLSEGAPYVVNRIHMRSGEIVESKSTDLGARSYGNKKPVFCLTSGRTFSGGEELSYDIQAFKRGVLIGETTGGGANPAGGRPLGHGFSATLPGGYAVHPVTGANWEGVGVKPDIAVPAEQALIEAQRLAVERLQADAIDPGARAAFAARLHELQSQNKPGASNSLKPAQLTGGYVTESGRPAPVVTLNKGQLFLQHPAAAPPAQLIPLGGDRYRLEGHPEDFTVMFSEQDGKVQLLAELGNWPPVVAQKKSSH